MSRSEIRGLELSHVIDFGQAELHSGGVLDDYWSSPAGWRHQRRGRQDRSLLAWIEQEPERKGRRGAKEATAFRRAARDGLIGRRTSGWPRAQLALDLGFTTTRKQPPNIERLAKHYLDLLAPSRPPSDIGNWSLYTDDRQIRLLFVAARHDWDPAEPVSKPSIHLSCQTKANAVAELEAAHDLSLHHDLDFEDDDLDGRNVDIEVGVMSDNARYFEASDDPVHQAIGADIRFEILHDLQEDFLRTSDRLLAHVIRAHARELLTGRRPAWRRMADQAAAQAGTHSSRHALGAPPKLEEIIWPLGIPLPSLPKRSGERDTFNKELHAACTRFLDRHPLLSPLVVPLRVTVLVVPSIGTDLDNIALKVLPVLHEHLRPHREPWLLDSVDVGMPPGLRSAQDNESRRRRRARLRSLGEYGVWAFQVIELHRRPEHPPGGWMALVLGHGENRHSLWDAAARDVDRFLEPLD